MKNILKLMALFAFLLCFISCDEDEKAEIPTLPVTAANLNGTWQLSEWNGQPMSVEYGKKTENEENEKHTW